jgi:hypothetical protein
MGPNFRTNALNEINGLSVAVGGFWTIVLGRCFLSVYSAVSLPMSVAAELLLAASTDRLWHRLVAVQALRDYGVHQSSKRKGPEEGP